MNDKKYPVVYIREIYERWQHMDRILSDERLNKDENGQDDLPYIIRYELWQAIKKSLGVK